jgi:hypothetical protein
VAKFRADVDEPRYYPTLGLSVNPADEIDLPADVVAAGLTLLDAPAKSKKSETPVDPTPADVAAEPAQGE